MIDRVRTMTRWTVRALLGAAPGMALMSGVAGCAGDDTSGTMEDGGTDGAGDVSVRGSVPDSAPTVDTGVVAPAADSGTASATFNSSPIDFGAVGCGAPPATQVLTITGGGDAPLVVTAATNGSAFSVTPSSLTLGNGVTGTLTVAANVPGSTTAATAVTGALNLFTNDPAHANVSIPLSATASGAALALGPGTPATISFPTSAVGIAAAPVTFSLVNVGNLPASFTLGAPSSAAFSLPVVDGGGVAVQPGATWFGTANFTPPSTAMATATAAVVSTGTFCGQSVASIGLSGQGTVGHVSGYPSAPIDFGSAPCGGAAPTGQSFVLTNSGSVMATITAAALTGAPGFTTTAAPGHFIPGNGGTFTIHVSAPAIPTPSPLAPLTATLTIKTDADDAPHVISLTESPSGAVLAFDMSPTPSFGNFGSVGLLGSASQAFNVKNTGNSPATVTVATASGSAGGPFSIASPSLTIAPGASQSDSVTFIPNTASPVTDGLALSTSTGLCGALPAAVPLSGIGLGGGPSVAPASLAFAAICGGGAPAPQTFTVANHGSANLTWALGPVTGPGAAAYSVIAQTPPGLLLPGESAIVSVRAAAVPSPAPNADPASLAAQVAITTDVPLDPTHIVTLGETPIGDQLSFGIPGLRFGQVAVGTTVDLPFTVINQANAGSPAATLTLALTGSGATAYGLTPSSLSNLAPSGGVSPAVSVVFAPTSAIALPATVAVTTPDPLCMPLPSPLPLSGTGTQGKVAVSVASLSFGQDPNDAKGLVGCGSTGPSRTFTVTNAGNESFQITSLALGRGGSSPYAVSGATLPATLPIGGGVTLTVTPKAIPTNVANPNDITLFSDTLTITSNAANDSPHPIALTMQARGAVIADTPLGATWSFGTIGFGSIGTITSTIRNTGNAPATVQLMGVAQPSIFGLQTNPTSIGANGVTALVGEFTPPSADGAWSDQGSLVVSGDVFCAPLPAAWSNPSIVLSGSSNGSPAITMTGDLAFPTTSCGSAAPAARTVQLTNNTNVAWPYTLRFVSGTWYSVNDAGPGTIPANGVTTIAIAPKTVTPGPTVQPGAAPYADDLVVTIGTSPPSIFTLPISWALDGAVLSLPQGAGPRTDGSGNAWYPVDSLSGFTLPLANTGTDGAFVTLIASPSSAFSIVPSGAVSVLPAIPVAPQLTAGSAAPSCPATATGSVSFAWSGPVCQPLPLSSVSVHYCAGALP